MAQSQKPVPFARPNKILWEKSPRDLSPRDWDIRFGRERRAVLERGLGRRFLINLQQTGQEEGKM